MDEVSGSIPLRSTIFDLLFPDRSKSTLMKNKLVV